MNWQELSRLCNDLDRMRGATTTHESELVQLRSEALVSQQTIDTLRRQITTTTATHESQTRPGQEQQICSSV
jgi:hypothetical protein